MVKVQEILMELMGKDKAVTFMNEDDMVVQGANIQAEYLEAKAGTSQSTLKPFGIDLISEKVDHSDQ